MKVTQNMSTAFLDVALVIQEYSLMHLRIIFVKLITYLELNKEIWKQDQQNIFLNINIRSHNTECRKIVHTQPNTFSQLYILERLPVLYQTIIVWNKHGINLPMDSYALTSQILYWYSNCITIRYQENTTCPFLFFFSNVRIIRQSCDPKA